MRILTVSIFLAVTATAASAGPLTCWYNAEGTFTGADGGSQGLPEDMWGLDHAVAAPNGSEAGSDYAYLIVLPTYESGDDCPQSAEVVMQ